MLVVAPTRELAVQIKEECDKFGGSSDIKNTCVYGGVPKSSQAGVKLYAEPMRRYSSGYHGVVLYTQMWGACNEK